MFKGYISNTIGRIQWTIHAQSSFLIPYHEQIPDRISRKSKEPADDILLTIMRKDLYKILGEFKVFHANEKQTYLVKMYKYSGQIKSGKKVFCQYRTVQIPFVLYRGRFQLLQKISKTNRGCNRLHPEKRCQEIL